MAGDSAGIARLGLWLGERVSRLKWLVSGKHVPESVARVLTVPVTAFLIAFLAFVLGLAGSVFSTEIRGSTRQFLAARAGSIDVMVCLFWATAFVWAVLFYLRLIAESDEKSELVRAIQRCPNPRVLHTYGTFCERVEAALRGASDGVSDESIDHRVDRLQRSLVSALRLVLEFTREFSDPVPGALRGCNVMLVSKPDDLPNGATLRFYPVEFDRSSLLATLFMPPGLVVSSASTVHVPSIALPVPASFHSERGTRRCLPGAPFALLTGQISVHRDTRNLPSEADFDDLDGEVRKELTEYFGPRGEGRNVRSFASVRVGDTKNPIAVLNLDYSQPDILGLEEYYGTFLALISPVLLMLREPLDLYGKAIRGSKLAEHERRG